MNKLFLALLSGMLMAFSWPSTGGLFPLIFFAFVPLLILEHEAIDSRQVFLYSFLSFFIFNLITTYWIHYATFIGAIMAFLVNATLMAMAFWLFHKVKKLTSDRLGYLFFILSWLSMEYLHLNWDLSWPWLTIGNVFANFPLLVQWYEFTGFMGGSLWVILINLLLFVVYQIENQKNVILILFMVFLLPLLFSVYMYYEKQDVGDVSMNVLIVQPNVDPYIDKFSKSYQDQLQDFITLSKTSLSQETQLLLAPETVLLEALWENKIESTYSISELRKIQIEFPNLNIIVGATTYKMFENQHEKTSTARQIRDEDLFYDVYNSAVLIPKNGDVKIYHKEKLVPGAEKMPFPSVFDPLAKLAVNLGGTSGSLGNNNYLNTFLIDETVVSPLICYESVYGDLGLRKAELLVIITNDGWWKNTAGYKQHFQYARLRAIEQRKSIVRSANTGISGVINRRGDIIEASAWDEAVCLPTKVGLNNSTTFYSKFGDYLGRISVFISSLFLMISFVEIMRRR